MVQTASDLLTLFSRYYFTLLMLILLVGLAQRALRDMRRGETQATVAGRLNILSPGEGKTTLKPGQNFILGADSTIGRSRRSDIRLGDDSVRATHAQIYAQADHLWLVDLGGDWGTFLNGEPVQSRTELFDGDVLQLGRVLMRVRRADGMPRPEPDEDEYDYDDEYTDEYDEDEIEAQDTQPLTEDETQPSDGADDPEEDETLLPETGEDSDDDWLDEPYEDAHPPIRHASPPQPDEETQGYIEEGFDEAPEEETDPEMDEEMDADEPEDEDAQLLQELQEMRRRQQELEEILLSRKRRTQPELFAPPSKPGKDD